MDNSLIPRPFSPTDAKRRTEENAREAERRSSARNASSSTIGAGGRLDLAGDINVLDAGVVRVIGKGMNNGVPYEVTAEVTNFVDTGELDYQSPGMLFSSALYGNNVARIYSRDGRSVTIAANDAASKRFGQITASADVAGIYLGTSGPTVYETRLQAFQDQVNAYLDRGDGDIRAGLHVQDASTAGGEVRVGHVPPFPSISKKAQLRTRDGGKLWLESNGTKAAAVIFDGAGNIDIQTTGATGLTLNGSAIGGAVSSVAGKTGAVTLADIGLDKVDNTRDVDKPISTKTQTALDGKASKDGAASLVAYTAGTDLNGVSPKVRYMAGGSNIQFDSGILFNAARAAYAVLCTLPATHRPTVFKDFGMVTSKGWITAQLRPDGTIITGTAFAANDYIVLGSIAPLPLSFV